MDCSSDEGREVLPHRLQLVEAGCLPSAADMPVACMDDLHGGVFQDASTAQGKLALSRCPIRIRGKVPSSSGESAMVIGRYLVVCRRRRTAMAWVTVPVEGHPSSPGGKLQGETAL